jgi:hypothetical protein
MPPPLESLHMVLLIVAAICFGLAAANLPARINLTALGLLFWILTVLVPAGGK